MNDGIPLFEQEIFLILSFNPNEARDPHGRWTSAKYYANKEYSKTLKDLGKKTSKGILSEQGRRSIIRSSAGEEEYFKKFKVWKGPYSNMGIMDISHNKRASIAKMLKKFRKNLRFTLATRSALKGIKGLSHKLDII